jgi:hypothetical protein
VYLKAGHESNIEYFEIPENKMVFNIGL